MASNRTLNRLETAFVEATREIRSALADTNLTDVSFRIEAEGRVDGDLKISYRLGPHWSTGETAEGGRLGAVLNEFLRRNGWKRQNQPLMLTQQVNEALNSLRAEDDED